MFSIKWKYVFVNHLCLFLYVVHILRIDFDFCTMSLNLILIELFDHTFSSSIQLFLCHLDISFLLVTLHYYSPMNQEESSTNYCPLVCDSQWSAQYSTIGGSVLIKSQQYGFTSAYHHTRWDRFRKNSSIAFESIIRLLSNGFCWKSLPDTRCASSRRIKANIELVELVCEVHCDWHLTLADHCIHHKENELASVDGSSPKPSGISADLSSLGWCDWQDKQSSGFSKPQEYFSKVYHLL